MVRASEAEARIELWVERRIDALDRRLMSSGMSSADYEAAIRGIDKRAADMLKAAGVGV